MKYLLFFPFFIYTLFAQENYVDMSKDILKKSIEFQTVRGKEQTQGYAKYIAELLQNNGYLQEEIIITPKGDTASLEVILKGKNAEKPLLILGHMDVVGADPKDWERDPFIPVEENGYIFGRGSLDNKYSIAMMVTTLIRLKKQNWVPQTDIIMVLTGDEETNALTTIDMAKKYQNAQMALNGDAGGGALDSNFNPLNYQFVTSEKSYVDFKLEFTDPGGHSSRPTKGNPIYRLSKILNKLSEYNFVNTINDTTRLTLMDLSKKEKNPKMAKALKDYLLNPQNKKAADILASTPEYIGQIRTTCTATLIQGGHAPNALPQRASANINCRIFPGITVQEIQTELAKLFADPTLDISIVGDPVASPASPLNEKLFMTVKDILEEMHPKLSVVPSMIAGATDCRYFRAMEIACYGVSPLFMRSEDSFMHGLNERVPTNGIEQSLNYWYQLLMKSNAYLK